MKLFMTNKNHGVYCSRSGSFYNCSDFVTWLLCMILLGIVKKVITSESQEILFIKITVAIEALSRQNIFLYSNKFSIFFARKILKFILKKKCEKLFNRFLSCSDKNKKTCRRNCFLRHVVLFLLRGKLNKLRARQETSRIVGESLSTTSVGNPENP